MLHYAFKEHCAPFTGYIEFIIYIMYVKQGYNRQEF